MRHKNPYLNHLPKSGSVPVSKLSAAISQLETAITLWVNDQDPVSVCTLTHAGYSLIRDLNKKLKAQSIFDLPQLASAPNADEIIHALYFAGPNFFKHARSDPDETFPFNPRNHLLILFDAVRIYGQWHLQERPIFVAFLCWLNVASNNDPRRHDAEKTMESIFADRIGKAGKKEIFEKMLPVAEAQFGKK